MALTLVRCARLIQALREALSRRSMPFIPSLLCSRASICGPGLVRPLAPQIRLTYTRNGSITIAILEALLLLAMSLTILNCATRASCVEIKLCTYIERLWFTNGRTLRMLKHLGSTNTPVPQKEIHNLPSCLFGVLHSSLGLVTEGVRPTRRNPA